MQIRSPKLDELENVLQLTFRYLAPEEQTVRIQTLLPSFQNGTITMDGIFIAEENGQFAGVLYSQQRPDGSVLLFPPVNTIDNEQILPLLFTALKKFCNKNSAAVAVALVDDLQTFDEELFQSVGKFEFLSEMICLLSVLESNIDTDDTGSLTFLPMSNVMESIQAELALERMEKIVQQTYKNSKDFPRLMKTMPVYGVLRSYQQTAFLPELWFFIQRDDQDIGALLLTDIQDGHVELTYMGLAEEVRRQGLSREIIRFAQHTALRRNGQYLLTSVDERNPAALKAYLANGFKVWDRKRVFARFF